MSDDALKRLPGAEIVLPGLEDLAAGRPSVNASAVQAAAPRLRRAGVDVPPASGDAAHSRYNAIIARVVSFAGAAERARGG